MGLRFAGRRHRDRVESQIANAIADGAPDRGPAGGRPAGLDRAWYVEPARAVFSAEPSHGYAVARRIESGLVAVDQYGALLSAPFGGVKASGVGREMGTVGLESFLEYQAVVVPPVATLIAARSSGPSA